MNPILQHETWVSEVKNKVEQGLEQSQSQVWEAKLFKPQFHL